MIRSRFTPGDIHRFKWLFSGICTNSFDLHCVGNDSNLLIVFYVQIMPDDFVMQLHRF
ncbi:serine/threonine-protein phosphatase 2 [Escherichia coli]|nr:serine/threonine-protein phosphatase 2 [Escherichia coli]